MGEENVLNEIAPQKTGKPRLMTKAWDELKKGGGLCIPADVAVQLMSEPETKKVDLAEAQKRVDVYFRSCQREIINEETGESEYVWAKAPTKSGLALVLGVTRMALYEILNKPRVENPQNQYSAKILPEAIPFLKRVMDFIEVYYEEKLGENRNNAGTIFWLTNKNNSKWSNEQEFKFGKQEQVEEKQLTLEDLKQLEDEEDEV
jgi:hypothetical protein